MAVTSMERIGEPPSEIGASKETVRLPHPHQENGRAATVTMGPPESIGIVVLHSLAATSVRTGADGATAASLTRGVKKPRSWLSPNKPSASVMTDTSWATPSTRPVISQDPAARSAQHQPQELPSSLLAQA